MAARDKDMWWVVGLVAAGLILLGTCNGDKDACRAFSGAAYGECVDYYSDVYRDQYCDDLTPC